MGYLPGLKFYSFTTEYFVVLFICSSVDGHLVCFRLLLLVLFAILWGIYLEKCSDFREHCVWHLRSCQTIFQGIYFMFFSTNNVRVSVPLCSPHDLLSFFLFISSLVLRDHSWHRPQQCSGEHAVSGTKLRPPTCSAYSQPLEPSLVH